MPAVALPAVVVGGVLVGSLPASAQDPPPPRTAEQVLALAAGSQARQFSGDVEQRSDLGIPSLSGALGSASPGASSPSSGSAPGAGTLAGQAAALDLLTGTHTARVYADGPTRTRIQVLDRLAERDVIRDGTQVWTWDSKANAATRLTLPSTSADPTPTAPTVTPDRLAQRFLTRAAPSTAVGLGPATTVAGRSAYQLILTPRTAATLVSSVAVAVDAGTGLPLSVDVFARGQQQPAFHTAFTALDLRAPDASRFRFTPPAGATVTQQALPTPTAKQHTPAPAGQRPAVRGSGWDAIMVVPAAAVPAGTLSSPLITRLATPVPGGRVLSTSLVTVLLADDGRVLAGAVPLSALQAAAAR